MSVSAEQRATRHIAVALGLTTASALGLAVLYALGGQSQLEGILLALALGGLGYAFVVAARRLLPQGPFTEDREPLASSEADLEGFGSDFDRLYQDAEGEEGSGQALARRRFLLRMFGAAVGAMGLAALFPIASLGPRPGDALFETKWRKGSRVVDEQGKPVKAGDLKVGGVLTVFPEGWVGAADSQTLLIRATDHAITTRPGREDWSPRGYVAYSKICTHAGCPVGLYQHSIQRLLCPCHQSTFEVLTGATPVFGPATRALPQLPLMVDENGDLRAQHDFDQPVGPGFWNRER
ncbi:MAG TPA: Rieske 2Fe-2S domain-containing protein [Acidimicrobiia bacterium]|nr:Rieske 2Fe-2S domain-containing protein [Acidimicrobiia bacterium]